MVAFEAQQWPHYCTLDAHATAGTESSAVPDAAELLLVTASHGRQTLHSWAPAHCSAANCDFGWDASYVRSMLAHTDAAFVRGRHTSDCAKSETCFAVVPQPLLLLPQLSTGRWTNVKRHCPVVVVAAEVAATTQLRDADEQALCCLCTSLVSLDDAQKMRCGPVAGAAESGQPVTPVPCWLGTRAQLLAGAPEQSIVHSCHSAALVSQSVWRTHDS